jgi:predicted cupin superfamily sugar epimerase
MLQDDGTHTFAMVGANITAGQLVQLLIPGNTFHTARIIGARRWFLGASTEWPGVVPTEDVELGNADQLAASHPDVAAEIHSFPMPAAQ